MELRNHQYARIQETTHGDQLKDGNETNVVETIPVSGIVELPDESPAMIEVPESSTTVGMPQVPRRDTE